MHPDCRAELRERKHGREEEHSSLQPVELAPGDFAAKIGELLVAKVDEPGFVALCKTAPQSVRPLRLARSRHETEARGERPVVDRGCNPAALVLRPVA